MADPMLEEYEWRLKEELKETDVVTDGKNDKNEKND